MSEPEVVARCILYQHEDTWSVGIGPVEDCEEHDVDGFATPGAALDFMVKWATDRGLVLPLLGLTLDIVKPGGDSEPGDQP